MHQKRVWHHHVDIDRGLREMFRPARRPMLEPEIADANGCIRRLLRRERARLNRAPGRERIGEEGQLVAPREAEGVVAVADVRDQPSNQRQT